MEGVQIRRVRYWTPGGQALASGVGGIVPNLRTRPWLAIQVPTLIGGLVHVATKLGADVDLVHAHWVYPSGVAGLAAARKNHLPLVVTSHGGDLNLAQRFGPLRAVARWVSAHTDACIGVSHAMVQRFLDLGISSDRVRFIPLGTELPDEALDSSSSSSVSQQIPQSSSNFRVVYVGSLIPRKSVDTLLEAHRILELRGRELVTLIVGSGPTEPQLRAMVASTGLRGVHFTGEQPPRQVPQWIRSADVLVLPSRSEGRGLVLLEAMVLGLPVIASDIPGPRELVIDGKTGFLFPAGDAAMLAEKLDMLIQDPELRRRLGRGGRNLVHEEGLTVQESARRHLALYESVIRRHTCHNEIPT